MAETLTRRVRDHHGLPAHEVVLLLGSDPDRPPARILRQLNSPPVLILLVAGVVTAVLGEPVDSGAELVDGEVGTVWQGAGEPPEQPVTAETFTGFAEPGFATPAESTLAVLHGTHPSVVIPESRVALTDEAGRRRSAAVT